MKNDSINKRIKHREDMFLRRLFGILARMAKIDGKVDACFVTLPPSSRESGPFRRITLRFMNFFGT